MTARDDTANQLLEGAYALETPADNLAYYRDFASHYDASFADAMGYAYPGLVAQQLIAMTPPDGPILDIGCGTGLVAAHLRDGGFDRPVDGVDISPEMLAVADTKGLYSHLHAVDLTQSTEALPTEYAGLISAGTFTHGHIGPDPLVRLVGHCRAGAIAVIGVNAVHYQQLGFAPVLGGLADSGNITRPDLHQVKIFDSADPKHADDTAFILTFQIK